MNSFAEALQAFGEALRGLSEAFKDLALVLTLSVDLMRREARRRVRGRRQPYLIHNGRKPRQK